MKTYKSENGNSIELARADKSTFHVTVKNRQRGLGSVTKIGGYVFCNRCDYSQSGVHQLTDGQIDMALNLIESGEIHRESTKFKLVGNLVIINDVDFYQNKREALYQRLVAEGKIHEPKNILTTW